MPYVPVGSTWITGLPLPTACILQGWVSWTWWCWPHQCPSEQCSSWTNSNCYLVVLFRYGNCQYHVNFVVLLHVCKSGVCSFLCTIDFSLTSVLCFFLFHSPTTCRYIRLPPFLYPPSSHLDCCTIQSYIYDLILSPCVLYNIYLVMWYDLIHSHVQYTSQSHSYDY